MNKSCPLCNGLIDIYEFCPDCGGKMEDGGAINEYYDPYSPYIEIISSRERFENDNECLHLIYCPFCGRDKREKIKKVLLDGYKLK